MNEKFHSLIWISLKLVPKGPIDNESALVQVMASCWPGDKPSSEPIRIMLIQLTDAYMQHLGEAREKIEFEHEFSVNSSSKWCLSQQHLLIIYSYTYFYDDFQHWHLKFQWIIQHICIKISLYHLASSSLQSSFCVQILIGTASGPIGTASGGNLCLHWMLCWHRVSLVLPVQEFRLWR